MSLLSLYSSWTHCTFWLHSQNSFLWVQLLGLFCWFSGSRPTSTSHLQNEFLKALWLPLLHFPLTDVFRPLSVVCRPAGSLWATGVERWTANTGAGYALKSDAIQPLCHATSISWNPLPPGSRLDTRASEPWLLSSRVCHQKVRDWMQEGLWGPGESL